MELAKLNKEQRQAAERMGEMLTRVVAEAWQDVARPVLLVERSPDWSDRRWAMALWQAPERHRLAIAVPEDGIPQLVQETVPGFEQAAPMLKWEEPFLRLSEDFWKSRIPWELADLEMSDDPESWLAQRDLLASLVVFSLEVSLPDEQSTPVYFVFSVHELTSVNGNRPASGEQSEPVKPAPAKEDRGEAGAGFPAFKPLEVSGVEGDVRNIDLILDVPLTLTVELGRTVRSIREVLEMGPGSLVELDRMAGESVDVLVNNRLVAKGEVVVIDENFGVRITDIITPKERLQRLG